MNVWTSLIVGATAVLFGAGSADAAEDVPAPQEIIANSIAYHDPNGVWDNGELALSVRTVYSEAVATRLGSKENTVELWMSPAKESFRYITKAGEEVIEYTLNGTEGSVTVDGVSNISDEDRVRLRIREPKMYRDYFGYLYGMPMKLRDTGTNVDPEVNRTRFNGQAALELRVTYDPKVGEDIWYFYFDEATYALTGYKFVHDEEKNDGEYISFEGEVRDEATGMRLPKARAWYYNTDDKHLATDDVVSMSARRLDGSR